MKVSFVNKVKFHIKKLYRKAKLPGDDSSQKMPSCTCLKASYTLEAAVIFPLVAGFFVFILFFFRVIQVESQVKAALYYSSRMSALASSANVRQLYQWPLQRYYSGAKYLTRSTLIHT